MGTQLIVEQRVAAEPARACAVWTSAAALTWHDVLARLAGRARE